MDFHIASLVSKSILACFRSLFCIAVNIFKLTVHKCSTTDTRYATRENNRS